MLAGLFSATQTDAVKELARAGLRNPVRVNVAVTRAPGAAAAAAAAGGEPSGSGRTAAETTQKTPSSLQIRYMVCESQQKLGQLTKFLLVSKIEKLSFETLDSHILDVSRLKL